MIRLRAFPSASSLLVSASLALAACGGSIASPSPTGPGATVNGTIQGTSFAAGEALSARLNMSGDPANPSYALIVGIADTSGVCARFGAGAMPKSTRLIALALTDTDAAGRSVPVSSPGVYTLFNPEGPSPGKRAAVLVTTTDASCATTKIKETAGTVTIDAIDGDTVSGSADVTLDTGEHFTAQFRTESCPAAVAPMSNPRCE